MGTDQNTRWDWDVRGVSGLKDEHLDRLDLSFLVIRPFNGRGFSLVLSRDFLTLTQEALQGPICFKTQCQETTPKDFQFPDSNLVFCNPLFTIHFCLSISLGGGAGMCVCEYGCLCATSLMWSQRIPFGSWFSPSIKGGRH